MPSWKGELVRRGSEEPWMWASCSLSCPAFSAWADIGTLLSNTRTNVESLPSFGLLWRRYSSLQKMLGR